MDKTAYSPLRQLRNLGLVLATITIVGLCAWLWDSDILSYEPSNQILISQSENATANEKNSTGENLPTRSIVPSKQNPTQTIGYPTRNESLATVKSTNNSNTAKDENRKLDTVSLSSDTDYRIAGVRVIPLEKQNFPKEYIKAAQATQRNIAQQMAAQGFVDAEEFTVKMIHLEAQEVAKTKSTTPESWTNKLGFRPVNLQGTELSTNSRYIGLAPSNSLFVETANQPETVSNDSSSEKYISRLYQSDNLGLVKLTEHVHNQPPVITPEFMNDKVSGIPAYYYVQKAPDGATLASLTWLTESRAYTLESTLDVTKSPEAKDMFLNLANSIPVE